MKISFNGITIESYGERTILSELENNKIYPIYNCRNGHCGLCVANLVAGTIKHNITSFSLKNKEILPCSCFATSDVIIKT